MARALRVAAAMSVVLSGHLAAQDPESGRKRTDITYAGVEYNHVAFNVDGMDPWRMLSLSLGNRSPRGTYIARLNMASRFDRGGVQGELDAYPRISEKLYAFVNIGYSGAAIFPDWRSGGELFAALPQAWEASAGYRQLRFGGPPVTLLTGSLGKYFGNSWVSARPYVRVSDNGTGASVGLMGRRYFADADNFIGARFSAGSSPPERSDVTELSRNSAWAAAILGSRTVRTGVVFTWSLGFEEEELDVLGKRKRADVIVGLRFQL